MKTTFLFLWFLSAALAFGQAGGGGGGVAKIVAGTNVTVSPTNGTGIVTVNASGGGGGTPGGSSGQIQWNNNGAFGGFTSSGDATINTSTGVVTLTRPAIGSIQAVYVQKNGNDSTGDGSVIAPYLTVAKGLSVISDAGSTKLYAVFIGPGRYDETAIALKPFVWLVGCGSEIGSDCRITVTGAGTNVTPDPTFNAVNGARGGVLNVYFRGTTNLNFDLTATGNSGSTLLELKNTTFAGNITYKAVGDGDGLDWRNGITFGNVTLTGGNAHFIKDILINGDFTATDSSVANLGFQVVNDLIGGNVVVTAANAKTDNVQFATSYLAGTFTQTQTSGSLTTQIDAVSYPAGTVTINSGTLQKTTVMGSLFNPLTGTVTLSGGAGTITNAGIDTHTAIILSRTNTSGSAFTYPDILIGSGSATVAGTATNNSTYNWVGLKTQ